MDGLVLLYIEIFKPRHQYFKRHPSEKDFNLSTVSMSRHRRLVDFQLFNASCVLGVCSPTIWAELFVFFHCFTSFDDWSLQICFEFIVDAFLLQGTGGELEGSPVCIAAVRNPAGSKGETLRRQDQGGWLLHNVQATDTCVCLTAFIYCNFSSVLPL